MKTINIKLIIYNNIISTLMHNDTNSLCDTILLEVNKNNKWWRTRKSRVVILQNATKST